MIIARYQCCAGEDSWGDGESLIRMQIALHGAFAARGMPGKNHETQPSKQHSTKHEIQTRSNWHHLCLSTVASQLLPARAQSWREDQSLISGSNTQSN